MFSGWTLILLSAAYVGVLFAIAHYGDRQPKWTRGRLRGPLIYSLSLAVYCTSWTFYGAVGTAARSGWDYLPIYLGPALLLLFGWRLVHRIIVASKAQNITSIADFIAARYGKSQRLAGLVTGIAVVGILPYIALQLQAVTLGYSMLTAEVPGTVGEVARFDMALLVAIALAVFTILFGTRQLDATENHHGMMLAIAFESLVKLLAFVAVALFALYGVFGGVLDVAERVASSTELDTLFSQDSLRIGFFAQTLLAFCAMFCLPRQFHVAVVENSDPRDLQVARTVFPVYLLLISLCVLPIAVAGLSVFPDGVVNADGFVLALPLAADRPLLALLAFIGGFSAATGMVIVAVIALSTMVCNDVVVPLLLRGRLMQRAQTRDVSRVLLLIRRATIVAIMLLAYGYFRFISGLGVPLAQLGLISFVAAAQFAPAVVGGVYWKDGNRHGAVRGLTTGFVLWAYTLLLPTLVRAGLLPDSLLDDGPGGAVWLRPEALLGLEGIDPISHALLWSLLVNVACYVYFSLTRRQSAVERAQAQAFVGPRQAAETRVTSLPWGSHATVADLRTLLEGFVGEAQIRRDFASFETARRQPLNPTARADAELARFSELTLASVIGAPSARLVMTSALRGRGMHLDDAAAMLDETSQILLFNQELLTATLENIAQGISVVDEQLCLVAWNRRYLDLFDYPDGLVRVGRPVADLVRFNAQRGLCGPGDVEEHVERRIARLREGQPHSYQRVRPDGLVLEMQGRPLPGGGFVTTFSDITEHRQAEEALRDSEQSIRFYTDNLPVMLTYVDREQRFRFTNAAYDRNHGWRRGEAQGRRVEEVLDANQYMLRREHIDATLAGKRQRFELALADADGGQRYMLATYTPDFADNGDVRGMFAVFQDITERRAMELALKEANETLERRVTERTEALTEVNAELIGAKSAAESANRSKTRFLAAASHDLLQPLNAARLFTSALNQSGYDDPDKISRLGAQIDGSLSAAEQLLGALLDISKFDAAGVQPDMSVFGIRKLFVALGSEFSALADARGLRFSMFVTDCSVLADRGLLRRILQNFLSNAIRYTASGGVLLGCRRRGKMLRIEVWDTGPGIAAENLEPIFEEFHRLDSVDRAGRKGLGLGLAITRRIADAMDTPLRVASRVGRGSMFSVDVPLVAATSAPDPVAAAPVEKGPFAGSLVLCLDNEVSILEGMQALLEGWSCEVLTATTLAAAKATLATSGRLPDVVLADYHLDDGITGVEALLRLNANWDKCVPGVVITADYTDAVRDEAQANSYHFMRKPIKPAQLRALLGTVLGVA